ncbi:hypothetical protein BT96DRAFT_1009730 [Gymnopus androsaceus JB14]|uniref:Uncharacterized protein n=1 Tax=Gymnopus androsaceus JB14 TaxID=1447944 RepID=A0A6A4GBZ1_9AGAR|nr:hypothetical protein BT96DRAFT_1009730 [Gymnopus androsaceus JB14]
MIITHSDQLVDLLFGRHLDDTIDVFPLAFLDAFFSPGDLPNINFANTCRSDDGPVFPGGQLAHCQFMAMDIQTCCRKNNHSQHGRSDRGSGFHSNIQAGGFATLIWDLFSEAHQIRGCSGMLAFSCAGPSSFVPGYSYIGSSYAGFGFNPSSIPSGVAGTTAHGQLQLQMPVTVIYTFFRPPNSAASSIFTSTPSESQEEEAYDEHGGKTMGPSGHDGHDSPPPGKELIAEARNERRYSSCWFFHRYPSLTLPLWTPTTVAQAPSIRKSRAIRLRKTAPLYMEEGTSRKVSLAGISPFARWTQNIDFVFVYGNDDVSLCRQLGCAQEMVHRRTWMRFLDIFGAQHHVQRENLYFVIGILDTPEHNHPDVQVHFNVFGSSKFHQSWRKFTTDTDTPFELGGPSYHEPVSGLPTLQGG